jgi:hypothetical protein
VLFSAHAAAGSPAGRLGAVSHRLSFRLAAKTRQDTVVSEQPKTWAASAWLTQVSHPHHFSRYANVNVRPLTFRKSLIINSWTQENAAL